MSTVRYPITKNVNREIPDCRSEIFFHFRAIRFPDSDVSYFRTGWLSGTIIRTRAAFVYRHPSSSAIGGLPAYTTTWGLDDCFVGLQNCVMEARRDGNQDGPAKTLGDILYSDKTRSHIPEEYWFTLVRSVAAGDQRALHSLFKGSHRIVFTLILRIIGNPATAEELTVDVFHDVWRNASRYDPINGSVVGWIMNQARSRAIDRLRFEHRKKRVNEHPDDPLPVTLDHGPERVYQQEEQNRLLQIALTDLTFEERQAIETAFFSELTYAETAMKLNQPLGTIKTRIRSGLQKLRRTFEGYRG